MQSKGDQLGVYPFVQCHSHGIIRPDSSIKSGFEISMCPQALFNKTRPSIFGKQFQCLEPCNIFVVEKHKADSYHLSMDFVRMACKYHTFDDDPSMVCVDDATFPYKFQSLTSVRISQICNTLGSFLKI